MSESRVSHRSVSRFSVSRFARFSVSAIRVSAFRVSKCVSVIRDSRFRIAATAIFTIIQFHHYLLASLSNFIALHFSVSELRFSDSRFWIRRFARFAIQRFAFRVSAIRDSRAIRDSPVHLHVRFAIRDSKSAFQHLPHKSCDSLWIFFRDSDLNLRFRV